MIEITSEPINPNAIVEKAQTASSGCVVTYVGLIRNESEGKPVRSVTYTDTDGSAAAALSEIADEIRQKWPVQAVAITHRVGELAVGDINLVVAVAAGHREEGFIACQYAIYRFKKQLPTQKKETYTDGSVKQGD